jgi:xylulokinase
MADVVGLPMHQQRDPRYNNALGAAFLAFYRLGLHSLDDIPDKVQIERTFAPNPANREIYDHLYAQFRQSFKRVRPIFHALNRGA